MFLLAFSLFFWVCFCRSFLSIVLTSYISPFNICCRAGFVELNSLNFCLSVNLLISPSFMNENSARYSKFACRFISLFFFFSFRTLSISCHSLLACRISTKRSAFNHTDFPCILLVSFPLLLLIFCLCV